MPSPSLSVVPAEVDDPVPAELRAVIELFANELAKIAFPDVDAAALKRQADELRAEAKVVARARQTLDAALAALASRTTMLAETAARGVAYARIYADAHPEREALVAAITTLAERATAGQAAPAATAPAKRRGRPRRQSAELFAASATRPELGDPT